MDVFERIDHREARLDAQKQRGVAETDVQVDEQHIGLGGARQHRRRIHRQRGRPDTALGADKREHLTCVYWLGPGDDPANRLTKRFGRERLLDALAHPGAHRLEHHARIECRCDQNHTRGRVFLADREQRGRQLRLAPHVDDDGRQRALCSATALATQSRGRDARGAKRLVEA